MDVNEALVAAFPGERYAPAVPLSAVVSPPYDVIGGSERVALAARDARNVVHVILPDGNGDRYRRAAQMLDEWRRQGSLVRDRVPGVYVVRQRFATPDGALHARTGVIAAVAAEPFAAGRVKPHEHTHAGPKQDRLALLRGTQTMCESLLMLSRDATGILRDGLGQATARPPVAQAELAEVEISVWPVFGAAADGLARAAGREALYIADGHHRYETAVAYRGENPAATRTLALIAPLGDPGLVILPTHRLVVGRRVEDDVLQSLAAYGAIERLGGDADIGRALAEVRARGGGCVVMLHEGGTYRLVRNRAVPAALASLPEVVRALDVAWTDEVVVPVLQRAAGAGALAYTPDLAAATSALHRGEASAAVLLGTPAVADVLDVADARAVMPPKATFFLPKVPSGIVFLNYAAATV